MAEDFVTYDRYRADLADFRSDMARFRKEIRADLASVRVEIHRLHTQTVIWLAGIVVGGVTLTVTLGKLL